MAANLLVIGAFALVIGFLVASGRALYKWQGIWRWLALIPVAIVGFVVIRIVIQPEAHNLWPFEVLLWCIGCTLALAALAWIRRNYGAA